MINVKQNNKRGFAMIMVLFFMTLITISLGIMTVDLKRVLSETNTKMLRCEKRNAAMSAKAWIEKNNQQLQKEASLEIPNSKHTTECTIIPKKNKEGQPAGYTVKVVVDLSRGESVSTYEF